MPDVMTFDLVAHLRQQMEFSLRTFGPGARAAGVIDHIRKELVEIEKRPDDVFEWVDVILLALDGAWRSGYSPEEICCAISAKQKRNEKRVCPDRKTADPDKAITHIDEARPVSDFCVGGVVSGLDRTTSGAIGQP